MLKDILAKIVQGDITYEDAKLAMSEMISSNCDEIVTGAFLTALRMRGESVDVLKAMYEVMMEHAVRLNISSDKLIDTCGTGGDKIKTFNISTAAAFVASLYVKVAKHGNRSMSGYSGSADVLEALGYNLDTEPSKVKESIENLGIGFIFAPKFHPVMKHVARVRKAIGIRTVFNILGPIANPANISAQLVGVSEKTILKKLAELLIKIGRENAMVVYAEDGIDELSTTCINHAIVIKDKEVKEELIDPRRLGLKGSVEEIAINSKEDAIRSFLDSLNGYSKPKSEIVSLNAAAALSIANVGRLEECLELARDAISSGRAYSRLKEFIKRYGDYSRLEVLEDVYLKRAS